MCVGGGAGSRGRVGCQLAVATSDQAAAAASFVEAPLTYRGATGSLPASEPAGTRAEGERKKGELKRKER